MKGLVHSGLPASIPSEREDGPVLVRIDLRLAKSGGFGGTDYWQEARGYVVKDAPQVMAAVRMKPDWQLVHIPSGFALPAVYSSTLAGIAPALEAINSLPSLATPPARKPGDSTLSGFEIKPHLVAALRACDTSRLCQRSLGHIMENTPCGVRAEATPASSVGTQRSEVTNKPLQGGGE